MCGGPFRLDRAAVINFKQLLILADCSYLLAISARSRLHRSDEVIKVREKKLNTRGNKRCFLPSVYMRVFIKEAEITQKRSHDNETFKAHRAI